MNTAKNIIAVDRIKAGAIVGLQRIGEALVAASPETLWVGIPIRVPARLTISDKKENGVRMYTAQLMFRTCEEPGDRERYVYRCKTANGRFYLIGSNDRPYPVSTVTTNHPDNMTDSQLCEVAVSYTASSPIPLIQ